MHSRQPSCNGPREGVPANPGPGLFQLAATKRLTYCGDKPAWPRHERRITERIEVETVGPHEDDEEVKDDRLRLIFTCCHPALAPEARVALTLREVCGLTTEEVARACLTAPPTLAQRIVRAKAKIRNARIPYQVPSAADLPGRLETVLQVVYLVFNEGYSASSGELLSRPSSPGKRSGWGGCSPSYCLSRTFSDCSRSCSFRSRVAWPACRRTVNSSSSTTRIEASGTEN